MQSIDLRNNVSPIHLERDSISIRGFLSTSGVANFLGLKYATILLRFQDAVPAPLAGEVDGTKYGPRCPQKVDRIHVLMENMFEKLSSDQRCDELDCLHLNIYAPPTASISGKEALPVFAWIHGGAFNNGDNTTEFGISSLLPRKGL
jgi:carboxylesterase type B